MGTKVDQRKYLLAQINASQYQTAYLKEKLEELEGGNAEAEGSDLAEAPANAKAAKHAAAKAPAVKSTAKAQSAAAEEEESDGLDFLDESEEEASAPSEDDVKVAVKKFVAAFGKDKVVGLLQKFKAKAIQDIKEKDYVSFIDLVNTALDKHKK